MDIMERLYVEPDENTLRVYQDKQQRDQKKQAELLKLRDAKDVTKDGTKVELLANIANLEDLDSVLSNGASGIGLLRSEFQYLGRENYPREGELYRVYRQVAQTMGDRKVVIRTVDLGADKQASYMDLARGTESGHGKPGHPCLSGPEENVPGTDSCHLPCQHLWKLIDHVSDDHFYERSGGDLEDCL